MALFKSVTDLIGNTPLVELTNIEKLLNLKARVLAKVEGLNPSGSIKDKAAFYMIKEAIKAGKINEKEQDTICTNPRGRAFLMTSPYSRTNVDVLVNDRVRNLFEKLRDDAK